MIDGMHKTLRRGLILLAWVGVTCAHPGARAAVPPGECELLSQQTLNLRVFQNTVDRFASLLPQPAMASALLLCLQQGHRELAETLMLYQGRLQGGAGGAGEVESAFLHYVINTGKPRLAEQESADLNRLAASYRESLQFGPSIDEESLASCGGPPSTLSDLRCIGQRANRKRHGRDDVVPVRLLDFDVSGTGYSMLAATWMSELAALAYWDAPLVTPQLSRWGFERIAEFKDAGTETRAFLAARGGVLVLSFRGTSGFRNVVSDVRVRRVRVDWADGRLHEGFVSASDTVWLPILAALRAPHARGKDIWVTGHSLGAALAQLTALRLSKAGYRVRGVYTYGTPRVGDQDFAADYDRQLGAQSFPHVNARDVVARVPPVALGFRAAASASIRQFTGSGHEMRLQPGEPSETALSTGAWRDALMESIDKATDFLPNTLRPSALRQTAPAAPPRVNLYSTTFERGPLDEHGTSEYAFKLVCASIETQLWPAERLRAGLRP